MGGVKTLQLQTVHIPEMKLKAPTEAIGYRIVVSPKSVYQSCWEFVVLVSPEDKDIAPAYVQELSEAVLSEGDEYSIYSLQFDENDDAKNLPVLSYVPGQPDSFEWLTVPRHFQN